MYETARDTLQISLLGDFQVRVGQRTVSAKAWRLRKARSLLKLLALAPSHRLHREQVLDLLWPSFEVEAALNNLHRVLHVLRHTLEPDLKPQQLSTYIQVQEEMILLSPDCPVWIDAEAFEALGARTRELDQPALDQEALALYRGELLPEDRYEDWAFLRRDQLHQTYVRVLNRLARWQLAHHENDAAIQTLHKLIAAEPASEGAHTQLIQLYSHMGQHYSALRQYQQLRETLRRLIGAEPSEAAQLLYQHIQASQPLSPTDDAPPFSPEKALRLTPTSLPKAQPDPFPAVLAGFIGREREIQKIGSLLTQTRLLTLTGTGGSGKTRLAIHAARVNAAQFDDGVHFIELAALADASLLEQTVASVLQIHETAGLSFLDALREALDEKHTLLLLDNCEHLLDECARLAHFLLQVCPRVHLLITSRQALGILGETVWTVPGLSMPDLEHLPPFEQLLDYNAIRLFVERASASRASFSLTVENAPVVLQICQKLDGMPLAIELAAVRVNMLAVDQILARLDDALALLVTGNRTAHRRQQTLRATYEWSYGLLSGPERALFRRLAVFRGGWLLEAAERVCAPDHFPGETSPDLPVFDLLARLVEKSLVVVAESHIPGEGAQIRYSLLETLRQYAAAQLDAAGETAAARQQHLQWYLLQAEAAEEALRGAQQELWLARLEREHDNLRAALNWANHSQGRIYELRLAGALWLFWSLRSYLSEGRRQLATALDRASSPELESEQLLAARAKALRGASVLAYEQSDFERAIHLAEESMVCYQKLGDLTGSAGALNNLGILAIQQGDYTRAARFCHECLELARTIKNVPLIATVLNNLGVIAGELQDLEQSASFYEQSLAHYRQLGDKDGTSRAVLNLGEIALKQARYLDAATLYRESLLLAQGLGNKGLIAYGLEGLAGAIAPLWERFEGAARPGQGPLLVAARLWGAAQTLRSAMNAPLTPSDLAIYERQVAAARARGDGVAFARAWSEGQAIPYDQALGIGVAIDLSTLAPLQALPVPSSSESALAALPADLLSQREREVALCLADGASNRVIAARLGLSERTVEHHVTRILAKLHLTSRAQIAVWVLKQAPRSST